MKGIFAGSDKLPRRLQKIIPLRKQKKRIYKLRQYVVDKDKLPYCTLKKTLEMCQTKGWHVVVVCRTPKYHLIIFDFVFLI